MEAYGREKERKRSSFFLVSRHDLGRRNRMRGKKRRRPE